jgi:hypothetical protein
LPTFNTLLLKPDALPTSIDGLLRVVFFSLICSLAVTWNFTIDDGLELELDNMMTSFVRRRRFAPTPTPSSYTRLILFHCSPACLPLLGVVVQMTRHCSNLASAVHKQLFADADFIASRSFSTALAFSQRICRKPHDIQSLPILASFPRFHSDTSSVALSSTWLHLLPPLVRHCHFTAPTA